MTTSKTSTLDGFKPLLSASEMPSDVILEGLYKSKLQDSVELQTVLALYDQETVRNKGLTSYLRLKTSVKLHIGQMMRTRSVRVRNEVVERGSVTKSQKRGKRESVLSGRHMDNVPKETDVVSVMTNKYKETCTVVRDEKERPSSPAPNSKVKNGEGREKSSKTTGNREKSSLDKRREIPCRFQ